MPSTPLTPEHQSVILLHLLNLGLERAFDSLLRLLDRLQKFLPESLLGLILDLVIVETTVEIGDDLVE